MTALPLLQTAAEQLEQMRQGLETPFLERLTGIFGLLAMIFLVLKTGVGRALFTGANQVFVRLLGFTRDGATFIFGNLVDPNVPVGIPTGASPDNAPLDAIEMWANTGASFAFFVLPTIIFFSSLMSVLYYLGIMQWVVRWIAWVMHRTMGTSSSGRRSRRSSSGRSSGA